MLQITRYLSLSEAQFLGCASAFCDALTGELNSAVLNLRKLENQRKGSAFAFEMNLDRHRYGALLVLERWGKLIETFGDHMGLKEHGDLVREGPARILAAEDLIGRSNQLLDAAEVYSSDVVGACALALHTVELTFQREQEAAGRMRKLGPIAPREFEEARGVFRGDLAAR
jgi:hypothetical protein